MQRLAAFVFFLLVTPQCLADASQAMVWGDSYRLGNFEYDFDENAKTWQEIQSQLPPYPKAADLVAIDMGPTTSNRYFIDFNSVNLGADGVVRYSVVIRSASGAETVSFEGMRCETGERKLYAFGRRDDKGGGEWSRNRFARWDIIAARRADSYHRELFFHYLCTVDSAGDLKKIQHAIKAGGIRRGE